MEEATTKDFMRKSMLLLTSLSFILYRPTWPIKQYRNWMRLWLQYGCFLGVLSSTCIISKLEIMNMHGLLGGTLQTQGFPFGRSIYMIYPHPVTVWMMFFRIHCRMIFFFIEANKNQGGIGTFFQYKLVRKNLDLGQKLELLMQSFWGCNFVPSKGAIPFKCPGVEVAGYVQYLVLKGNLHS